MQRRLRHPEGGAALVRAPPLRLLAELALDPAADHVAALRAGDEDETVGVGIAVVDQEAAVRVLRRADLDALGDVAERGVELAGDGRVVDAELYLKTISREYFIVSKIKPS